MADDKPIIVIKKKGGHGGHHGGAWKVAYADFVTAMMAFFMVMWLLNTAESTVKKAVASYFRKPGLFESGSPYIFDVGKGAGIFQDSYQPPKADDMFNKWQVRKRLPTLKEEIEQELNIRRRFRGLTEEKPKEIIDDKSAALVSKAPEEMGPSVVGVALEEKEIDTADIKKLFVHKVTGAAADSEEPPPPDQQVTPDMQPGEPTLMQIVEQIKQQVVMSPELKELLGEVDVKIDATGLEIEIADSANTSMFARGSAKVLPEAQSAFKKLAEIMGPLPNNIQIIGHTDAKPFSNVPGGYTNWDLSTARANEARKLLSMNGLPADKINAVVGRAATQLKNTEDPFHYSNRRITLRMEFDIAKTINPIQNPNAFAEAEQEVKKRAEEAKRATAEQAARRAAQAEGSGGLMNALPGRATYGPTAGEPEQKITVPSKPVHEMTPSEIISFTGKRSLDQLPPDQPSSKAPSQPTIQESSPSSSGGGSFPADPVFDSGDIF
jgi:chemotaxis protein MotB